MLVLFFLVGFNSNTHCVCIKECFCVNRSGLNLFSLSASSPSVSWTSAGKWDAALNPDRKIILNNSPLKLTSQLYIYIFLNPYMNFRPWGRYNSCLNLRTASVKVKFPPADSSTPVRGTRSLPCRNCRGGTRTDPQPRLPLVLLPLLLLHAPAQRLHAVSLAVEKWIPAFESAPSRR